jgi:asparagine synthase (glutamine-hydrolysing)
MPGIVGLFTDMPRQEAERQLQTMLAALRHQSFYASGTFSDESVGTYVGWVAHKNSFSDGMPLQNERRDTVLVFSGEEFPEPDTRNDLKKRGHELNGHFNSYLVHLYEQDPAFPAGLNGRFHGVVIDRARGNALLFNDRYGMHRIYYHQSSEALYFAAEAKAILAVCPELRSANPQSLGELVACGCVLGNRTLFRNIDVLPAGSAWVVRKGSVEKKNSYFQPGEWEQQPPLDHESYYQQIRRVFTRNLPRYFNGQERVGISLTGGLDTRVIMAWRRAAENTTPCYTFGGMFRDCEDVRVARRVATVCRQAHEVIPVADEFLARFPHYAERSIYLSDGTVDLTHSHDLFVNEKARDIAPVRMVGTYGSEILRQLVMFKPRKPAEDLFCAEMLGEIDRAEVTYGELRREHPVTFIAFRQSPWYHHGVLALEQTQVTVRSPYLDNELVKAVYQEPQPAGEQTDVRLRLIHDGNEELSRIPTDRGIGMGPGSLKRFVSRGILEFTSKAEYAFDYGMPQWLAQADHFVSKLHLERIFLGRHKLLHFRVWYRDALADYVRQMLLDDRTLSRPYWNRKGLERIVRDHLKGDRNYTNEIHKALTLELITRLFFDRK